MKTVRHSILLDHSYGKISAEKLDCMGHVQKRMGKHLLNLKARTKGDITHCRPIGGCGQMTEGGNKAAAKILWSCNSPKHN